MIELDNESSILILQKIARKAMLERGLIPDFPPEVIREINLITQPAMERGKSIIDLRNLLWCSIDNDNSRDLDQLTVAVNTPDGITKMLVAIADVDVLVKKNSALDIHASHNTTSIYTSVQIFPMLPEKLSTDFTSLNYNSDRLSMVFEMIIAQDGSIQSANIYRALVHNHAKLAYNSVSAWLEGKSFIPEAIKKVKGLDENIRQQYGIAQKLRSFRNSNGALNFDRKKSTPIFEDNKLQFIESEKNTSSKDMIEDFMIAVNGVSARYLASKNFPSIRRVVRTPKRWNRIVELASLQQYDLPEEPNSKSLDDFLIWSKTNDPEHFPDLSLSIIKLLGPGEYVVEVPGDASMGHFGLAVKDYSHSTAPNRRYPDIITQRLLKSAISGDLTSPYTNQELIAFAEHCTDAENSSKKVERQVEKSTYILLLESRIGEEFEAIITGLSGKGSWIRLLNPPVEGKLMSATKGIDVGDKLKVVLVNTDIERGFIDFEEAN